MRKPKRESPLSDAARELRVATRLVAFVAFVMLIGVVGAYRDWLPRALALPFMGLFLASALAAVWAGSKAHQKALEDRDKESGRAMIIAIAVQLGKQDDASLEKIKAKGGPAGEAAGMILQGRAEKAAKKGER